ncbi:MAG: enoyl-CoA hydratase-related protein, partial [Acidimicrobiia bacterium]
MIRTEERGRVAILWIDRHEQRNALDTEHCELLRGALGDVQAAGARAVVVTGEGSSFCAGADFGEVYGEGFRKALYEMLRRFTTSPVPIIAAVNGPAIGAGTQLALAADLRTVAPAASFAIPTATLGLAVDPWTIERLASLVGRGTASAMLIGCAELTATQAHERCLV